MRKSIDALNQVRSESSSQVAVRLPPAISALGVSA